MLKIMRIFSIFLVCLCMTRVYAQLDRLHGDFSEYKPGEHTGNQFRLVLWSDGHTGGNSNRPDLIASEWPINSGKSYVGQTMMKVGGEVYDTDGILRHIFAEANGNSPQPNGAFSGDMSPTGQWWSFLPLPGFSNPESEWMAMSHIEESWPATWPDKFEDRIDPGWAGSWNGYFGKNKLNADQESYFVMDDYTNREFKFYPDSTDLNRRGLGLRVTARGFQWSNALVEDIVFTLYDVKNIGTSAYDKIVFGQFAGPAVGNTTTQGGDNGDDNASYDLEEMMVYCFDEDNKGNTGWSPVGYYGLAFLETPGNPFDGIDNDYDAETGSGPMITETLFDPVTIHAGDPVIVIDYTTFEREKIDMPNGPLTLSNTTDTYTFNPGQVLEEIPNNLFDDNLNGLIDENNGSVLESNGVVLERYLNVGKRYIDYYSMEGEDNPLIDEFRDDGIDNNGDWNIKTDDVGLDGIPYTFDYGENDGQPTSGWQPEGLVASASGAPNRFGLYDTNLPGEPHIDKTDINESDMIGLTSFLLDFFSNMTAHDDELQWRITTPGLLDDRSQNSDTDYTFASGYFPLQVEQIERFSIAHVMGINLNDLMINKKWGNKAYSENYNFSKAPDIPIVTAIAGDNRVTLVWDAGAEESIDPISGKDFEGYRIYRSTDPGFNDMIAITDGRGNVTYREPMAQFDLVNNYQGYSEYHTKGIHFWLGENTGLVHTWTDTTAKNGFTYYYAVTSYDNGDGTPPTECTRYIVVRSDGNVNKGKNIAIVRPQAPALGYISPETADKAWLYGSTTGGHVDVKIVNPREIQDATYQIVFEDTLEKVAGNMMPKTKNFSLVNVTDAQQPDTLLRRLPVDTEAAGDLPIIQGVQVKLTGTDVLSFNKDKSSWNNRGLWNFRLKLSRIARVYGTAKASDYQIIFGDAGMDTSVAIDKYESVPVNFTVMNTSLGKRVKFAIEQKDGSENDFSAFVNGKRSDIIIFLEENENDSLIHTWQFDLTRSGSDEDSRTPQSGDVATILMDKPFLSNDVYQFKTTAEFQDAASAKTLLDDIKVVPNPYIIANSWEPLNPYANGRGPRELHFIHLPPECIIQIFSVRGQLVQTLTHQSDIWDGAEIWDMRSKDNLDIAYGVYVYHVDAGEIGQKIGKFAVIK